MQFFSTCTSPKFEEVGTVTKLTENIIQWKIDSFSILPKTEGSRKWSQEISNNLIPPIPSVWKTQVPKGSIELIFVSSDCKNPLNKCIRLGVVDKKNKMISCSDAKWVEKHIFYPNGCFRVQELLQRTELVKKVRFYCEAISEKQDQTANVSTNKEKIWGKYLQS